MICREMTIYELLEFLKISEKLDCEIDIDEPFKRNKNFGTLSPIWLEKNIEYLYCIDDFYDYLEEEEELFNNLNFLKMISDTKWYNQ